MGVVEGGGGGGGVQGKGDEEDEDGIWEVIWSGADTSTDERGGGKEGTGDDEICWGERSVGEGPSMLVPRFTPQTLRGEYK